MRPDLLPSEGHEELLDTIDGGIVVAGVEIIESEEDM
jgi:hypothetical protein